MQLLEREAPLARLTEAHRGAVSRKGRCVLIHGEAGIGKTSLLRTFLDALGPSTTALVAGCEALFTPRPLGPLVDLADHFAPSVTAALHEGRTSNGLFPGMLAHLRAAPQATVLAIEDLHWADEGTLDFVRYLARRIDSTPVLLALTYRDDEIGAEHPLRRVLGDLPAAHTLRVALEPLSKIAVQRLVREAGSACAREAQALWQATGGNPFFVTEVLDVRPTPGAPHADMPLPTTPERLPASVRDAVLARLARVGAARVVAEVVSVSPQKLERAIVEAMVPHAAASIDVCVAAGVLRAQGHRLEFRHELARQAVEQSLLPLRRTNLHRELFDLLAGTFAAFSNPTRVLHHAERGDRGADVLALAPLAAREAAAASAHRAAAAHYALALEHAHSATAAARAELLEAAAHEQRLIGRVDVAMATTREALALRRELGDAAAVATNLRLIAEARWVDHGDRAAAEESIRESLRLLEALPPGVDLAKSLCVGASLRSGWSDYAGAADASSRALALAESLGDTPTLIEALCVAASARLCARDDEPAKAQLERALALAIEEGLDDRAGQIFVVLQTWVMNHRDYARSLDLAQRGIAYCEARDLDRHLAAIHDRRATALAEMGRWSEADVDIDLALASPATSRRLHDSLRFLRARLNVRRGHGDAMSYWREVQRAPEQLRVGFRVPAVAAACAEAAWLRGDIETAACMARLGMDAACSRNDARLAGPAAVWLHRCGASMPALSLIVARQHALELAGDIDGAADAWARLSCPYECALTLLHGDEVQIRRGLDLLRELGAEPAARIAQERLRALGVRGVPRGPQPRTRIDPLGLTARERQIYELMVQGLGNPAIAQRMHRSTRTVEHHVASVFAKLGIGSRVELLARVAQDGLVLAA